MPVMALLALLLLCACERAAASTVLPLSISDLTGRSRQIFHGVCIDTQADLIDGDPVTHVRFVVVEPLKGMTTIDTLSVLLPGGEIDGIRYHISGMPAFMPDEEVVLFLSGLDGAGRVWPVGLAQGDFRVRRQPQTAPRVRRDFDGLRFQGSARAAALPVHDLALDELLDEIRSLTGAPGDSR